MPLVSILASLKRAEHMRQWLAILCFHFLCNPLLPLPSPPPPLSFIRVSVICVLRPSATASITLSTAAAAGQSDPLHASHELAPIISYKPCLLRADACVETRRMSVISVETLLHALRLFCGLCGRKQGYAQVIS